MTPAVAARVRLAFAAAALASIPIILLTVVRDGWAVAASAAFWRSQIGVHARSILCIPALIIADALCSPRLWRIVEHFVEAGLVGDRSRFKDAVAAARGRFSSRPALIVVAALSLGASFAIAASMPPTATPGWHRAATPSALSGTVDSRFSPAGWWHVAVSTPIVLTLVFGWLWRLGVWSVLLARITRCELRPVSSHPDHTAGLGFVGGSLRALMPVAFGFSGVAASRSLQILSDGGSLALPQIYFDAGYALFLIILCVAPLLVFTPTLILAARRGSLAYGSLAQKMGESLETRWLTRSGGSQLDANALHEQDFSATIDLYSIAANARGVRLVPVGRRDFVEILVSVSLPFLPIVLSLVPMGAIWPQVRELIF
jgi:hypothetical protein